MAIIDTDRSTSGAVPAYLLDVAEPLRLAAGVTVLAQDDVGILSNGADHNILIEGRVLAETDGIQHNGQGTSEEVFTLNIAATGRVEGEGVGVRVAASDLSLTNYGLIYGHSGIVATFAGGVFSQLVNTGVIMARSVGVEFNLASGESLVLNEGQIVTTGKAFESLGGSADVLINRGTLVGDVNLGAGNDRYDGRGGRFNGTVQMGTGNDYVLLGAGRERVEGGEGRDTIDLRATSGLRLALDGAFGGTGVAAGDTFTGIEIIQGSLSGRDVLRGDLASNTLFGNGGNDWLLGQGGDDRLVGGAGRDDLAGGTGNDAFVFNSLAERGDRISDFSNTATNNDWLELRAAAFGGLPTGALASARFRFSSGNKAVDADDRFILRKSDRTLWYDADGRGGKAPVLLADLPNKLIFAAQDILLV